MIVYVYMLFKYFTKTSFPIYFPIPLLRYPNWYSYVMFLYIFQLLMLYFISFSKQPLIFLIFFCDKWLIYWFKQNSEYLFKHRFNTILDTNVSKQSDFKYLFLTLKISFIKIRNDRIPITHIWMIKIRMLICYNPQTTEIENWHNASSFTYEMTMRI